MRILFLIYISFFFLSSVFANNPVKSCNDLIERIIPGYAKQFILEEIPAQGEEDVYEIASKDGRVVLRGNTGVALATAFHSYLKYTCKVHISWTGDQLAMPKTLPRPQKAERQVLNGKYRTYMNYCTLSYSAPWWNWERWQREIDYMAMNGINMPLFVTGLEAVWYNALLKFNFTDQEARTFLAGPAHIAWQWMQNIQSYGGPLPKSWIDSHLVLGQQILERERELGMTPIMQGFSGYVPREMKDKFPEADIVLQGGWGGFRKGAAQLNPSDPMFFRFGKAFLEERERLFGKNIYYAADPFHESKPPVNTPEYLASVGKAIHSLFKSVNKDAVWIMQGWSVYKDIITAVPKSDLIILDLNGARYKSNENFWGYPFVYGTLHNFGGRINMHGDLNFVAQNQYESIKKSADNLCGTGLFMEGINQNTVFYDLTFEMNCRSGAVNLEKWLSSYAERRYGALSLNATKAWILLSKGPYKPGTNAVENSSIIAARPELKVKKSGPNHGFLIPYPERTLYDAMGLLLKDKERLKKSEPYRFDLIDLQRQIMTNLGQTIYKKSMDAYQKKDIKEFNLQRKRFLTLLSDVDILLRSTRNYNFDQWITDARKWGTTVDEKNLLEKDATSLVTFWGYEGKVPTINDYSWREWSGLIEGFYKVRWTMFYDMLEQTLLSGEVYDDSKLPKQYDRAAFRSNSFYEKMADFEENFAVTYEKQRNPIVKGDQLALVDKFYKKYKSLFELYNVVESKSQRPETEMKTNENLGE